MSLRRTIDMHSPKPLNKERNPSFSSDEFEENITAYRENIPVLKDCKEISETKATAIKPICHTILELARSQLYLLNVSEDGVSYIIQNRFEDRPFDDLELSMLLLASAEKVAENDFESARISLSLCDNSDLIHGTPVERIVYYFSEALKEKINASPEASGSRTIGMDWGKTIPMDVKHTLSSLEPAMIESYQESSAVVIEHTGIQCILDNIESSKMIHLIDFGIRNGSHWIVLMQALAVRYHSPVELLKITAVGTSRKILEGTGKWLSSYAATLDLCFSFNIVLEELIDVKEDLFKVEDYETLAVYFPRRLANLLAWPNHLDRIIGVIKKLNPCVMIVNEIEATINSPIFLERFNEALVYFCAVFDCMNVRFENNTMCRRLIEEVYLRYMIQNMIIEEDTNRTHRQENIIFWRALFARFDLVETTFSQLALSQAKLLLKMTTFENFYTSEMDGNCLILGWNGIPLQSLSAWKFGNIK